MMTRRQALGALGASLLAARPSAGPAAEEFPIIDTHQHLWDRSRLRLPWLAGAADVLRRNYTTADYVEATRGLNVVKAVYMEVDVQPSQLDDEAAMILALCREGAAPTKAAVLGGRPASCDFAAYLDRFARDPAFRGVRQVLHSSETPRGYCLRDDFVRGVRVLGERGLSFDLCLRPAELDDGVTLVERCPDTRFVLDHCGNADPYAFLKRGGDARPSHDPEEWKRQIDRLAGSGNVVCKISGVVARARKGWTPDDLAPVVNFCLDRFGPDRVVFGGDWPVCLLGASYRGWVEALRAIVANRPAADQKKLWHDNAARFYRLA